MKKQLTIQVKKVIIVLIMFGATQIAMGSFTGKSDSRSKNRYSLKYFNQTFYKNASPFNLRNGYQYKGTQLMGQQKSATEVTFNSMVRYEKGNTTYIYPYKHKVSVPKFRTPTAPTVK